MNIVCKYCGCEDSAKISNGKPPHAYRADCAHCGKFYKWVSAADIDYADDSKFTDDELIIKYHGLAEYISELAGRAPQHHYIAEQKEFNKVCEIIEKRGLTT